MDRTTASEVAKRAGVNWVVTGQVIQTEPNIVLMSSISHAVTGEILEPQQVRGEVGDDIYAVVDKLSQEVRKDFSLPSEAKLELDRAVADVTTHSLDAYRNYLEGVDHFFSFRFDGAKDSFGKAIEYDSTFAMAHLRLAQLRFAYGYPGIDEAVAKAVRYSEGVTEKDRLYIESFEAFNSRKDSLAVSILERITERFPDEKEAFYWLGIIYMWWLKQPEKAAWAFDKAIELDPAYKGPYNDISSVYLQLGDFDKALWAIDKYISLAPDEPNPYDSKAALLAAKGELDKAIEFYQKALEVDPGFTFSYVGLGDMYLYKKDYAKSEAYYRKLSSSADKDLRSWGRSYLARIPLYKGKLNETFDVLGHGIAADEMEQAEGEYSAYKHLLRAIIYHEKNDLDRALEEIEKAIEVMREAYPGQTGQSYVYFQDYYVELLAENGDIAKAEKVAGDMKEALEESGLSLSSRYEYWHAVGLIQRAKGDLEASITSLERAIEVGMDFLPRYTLAKSYSESGRLNEAVMELEAALSRYDEERIHRLWNPNMAVKAYYQLGLAYEKLGRQAEAINQYEEFLDIWKDADPELEEVEDARRKLNNLKRQI
ncbi:MAG: tetratricopeptide repeat protein [Candidatus Latescibacteria bacterium]|nr:tetratricopeptide repeat protein [Candidatus Latescibacterota bacterium]NIO01061.1 tetratricopeptide repeat protein [Candidatus Latescibacterota bacterium]NIO27460.1 tetratricopeptide repeat protein [Candidatus Latescibacterota bacterium]NIO54982.1 tetratricopeptide repeat protein [Candidatus Latescibacterota bacterium]NIT01071.1 tetratricopeptide repeat protein [Candidatus Latescibacterota bacterium]